MKTTHRSFVSYIDRTREFYAALGYGQPYAWAHFDDVPFAPLAKPLAACRASVVTTASPPGTRVVAGSLRADKQVWSGSTDPIPASLFTEHLSWDKQATHTDDVGSFLPLAALRSLADSGRIASLAPRFHGAPTDYSQRRTLEIDAPEILRRCREDEVDVALLVPL